MNVIARRMAGIVAALSGRESEPPPYHLDCGRRE